MAFHTVPPFPPSQGSPYASDDYQDILTQHRMIGSMSRRGNCYDNAVMESWFATISGGDTRPSAR